jgi:hypothetical protein
LRAAGNNKRSSGREREDAGQLAHDPPRSRLPHLERLRLHEQPTVDRGDRCVRWPVAVGENHLPFDGHLADAAKAVRLVRIARVQQHEPDASSRGGWDKEPRRADQPARLADARSEPISPTTPVHHDLSVDHRDRVRRITRGQLAQSPHLDPCPSRVDDRDRPRFELRAAEIERAGWSRGGLLERRRAANWTRNGPAPRQYQRRTETHPSGCAPGATHRTESQQPRGGRAPDSHFEPSTAPAITKVPTPTPGLSDG